jgi:hypothetical protein
MCAFTATSPYRERVRKVVEDVATVRVTHEKDWVHGRKDPSWM